MSKAQRIRAKRVMINAAEPRETYAVTSDPTPFVPTPGKHRWVVLVPFDLSDEMAASVSEEEMTTRLGPDNVARDLVTPVFCYVCELPWSVASGKSCPGEPDGHDENGSPGWLNKPEDW
jgi:hypothetical protein